MTETQRAAAHAQMKTFILLTFQDELNMHTKIITKANAFQRKIHTCKGSQIIKHCQGSKIRIMEIIQVSETIQIIV